MSDLVLIGIATVLSSGAFAAVIGGMFGRRKISAEATEIVTRAAGEQLGRMQGEVTWLEEQVSKLRHDNAELEKRLDKFERRELTHRDLMLTHAGWDFRVQRELQKRLTQDEIETLGLFPAPPLSPPN